MRMKQIVQTREQTLNPFRRHKKTLRILVPSPPHTEGYVRGQLLATNKETNAHTRTLRQVLHEGHVATTEVCRHRNLTQTF